ncbi:MAG: endo-1,4-beta-xylanase [Phycisphaerales bacterium]|nr:endo-1,4-beta-xylanase [Phycisphaerales bacterium]
MIPGRVTIENGIITADAQGHANFAIGILYDAGNAGRLMLQTSILPRRVKPYMLSLELARHRIKSFLELSENWSLFHLSEDNPAVLRWEESRSIFTKALVCADQNKANDLARRALEISIDASERLAMAHAQILLHRRYATKNASNSTLGVNIASQRFDEPLRALVSNTIDIVKIPMQWSEIEPEEGVFQWGSIDRWVKWARDHKKHIIAGPLLDFTSKDGIPEWVKKTEHDYSLFRDKCYDHIERVVQRYGAAVLFWNVATGLNLNRYVKLSLPNLVDLVRTARLLVKQGRQGSKVMIELSEPFSEFVATTPGSCNAHVFLSRLAQEGVSLDALGVQFLIGGQGGRATRDLMLMSAKLDEFLHLDFPIIISDFGTPSKTIHEHYGWWKSPWDEERQEQWTSQMFAIAMSKPFVDSVIWTDLYDYKTMKLPTAGLISLKGKPRAVLDKLLAMRKRLSKPLGPLNLPKRKDATKENE